jgi:hypothetical protein
MPWREYVRLPEDAEERRRVRHSGVGHLIASSLAVVRLLQDYAVGMVALEAALEPGVGEITVDYVTARLEGLLSEDTIRRRIRQMARTDILETRQAGRARYYRLRPDLVEAVCRVIEGKVP